MNFCRRYPVPDHFHTKKHLKVNFIHFATTWSASDSFDAFFFVVKLFFKPFEVRCALERSDKATTKAFLKALKSSQRPVSRFDRAFFIFLISATVHHPTSGW